MKIVIDTNIIASAIFFGGKPGELVRLLMQDKLEVYVSPEIIEEYQATGSELKARYPGKNLRTALPWIISKCTLVEPGSDIHICRDPDDDKFLDCAVDGGCVLITTGDKDLLSIEEYSGIKIVTVSEFFKNYWKE